MTWLLAGAVVLLVALDVARLQSPRLNLLFFRWVPSLASPREAGAVASSTWYVLGAALTWGLFPAVARPTLLVLALADPAASVVGRLAGAHRWGKGSVEGSLAFLVVAMGVLLLTVGGAGVLAVALAVTVMEVLPWGADDNLTVPLGAAALLSLLVR